MIKFKFDKNDYYFLYYIVPPVRHKMPEDRLKYLENYLKGELAQLRRLKHPWVLLVFNGVAFKIYATDSVNEAMGRYWQSYLKGTD